MDFQGKAITDIIVNENKIENPNSIFENGKIKIPMKFLSNSETNYISVRYENEYDNDGSGCVSFIDVDTKQYLYTQFEPYMANRVFPLFDQPNLKAKMILAIACP